MVWSFPQLKTLHFCCFPAPSEGGHTLEFFNLFKQIFIGHLGYAANTAAGACLFLIPPLHPSSLMAAVEKQLTGDVGELAVLVLLLMLLLPIGT